MTLTGRSLKQKIQTNFLPLLLLLLSGCSRVEVEKKDEPILTPVSYKKIPGWEQDNFKQVHPALVKSCKVILDKSPSASISFDTTAADWKTACKKIISSPCRCKTKYRKLLEEHFDAFEVSSPEGKEGLFTGYYEPQLRGSYKKTKHYNVPIYKKPQDLVTIPDLGAFRDHLKGHRIAGRVKDGVLIPYDDHEKIHKGALKNKKLELLWTNSAVDHFFLQVQGSGRVVMTDGKVKRLGFDGVNGHEYTSIGRILVQKKEMSVEEASMQSIRAWCKKNPKKVQSLLNTNRSFVFFKELKNVPAKEGPLGSQGIPLTPERSLAVDPKYIGLGTPVWVSLDHPLEEKQKIERLMVAQDTGGAIKGIVRGDVFWGWGKKAFEAAGKMKSFGRYLVLLPKKVL